jgi:hypothetical protein
MFLNEQLFFLLYEYELNTWTTSFSPAKKSHTCIFKVTQALKIRVDSLEVLFLAITKVLSLLETQAFPNVCFFSDSMSMLRKMKLAGGVEIGQSFQNGQMVCIVLILFQAMLG